MVSSNQIEISEATRQCKGCAIRCANQEKNSGAYKTMSRRIGRRIPHFLCRGIHYLKTSTMQLTNKRAALRFYNFHVKRYKS